MQRAVNEAVVRGKGDGDYAATMFGVVELRLDDAQRRSRQAPPGAWTPISPAPALPASTFTTADVKLIYTQIKY